MGALVPASHAISLMTNPAMPLTTYFDVYVARRASTPSATIISRPPVKVRRKLSRPLRRRRQRGWCGAIHRTAGQIGNILASSAARQPIAAAWDEVGDWLIARTINLAGQPALGERPANPL